MKLLLLLFLCSLIVAAAATRGSLAGAEVVDFLTPQGHVSVDAILLLKAALPEDYDRSLSSAADASSSSLSGIHNYSQQVLELRSQACESIPVDWIPCNEEHDPHCADSRVKRPCIVPFPPGYMHPPSWPSSMNKVRSVNVPNVNRDAVQQWIQVRKSREISFKSSKQYVDYLLQLLPGLGKSIRLVLDLEDGVGNLSLELEKYGVLTLALEQPSTAVLVLERGFPALVKMLRKKRLPFPSQTFDLIHCGTCDVPWTDEGGLFLPEADRLLQQGGIFLWINKSGSQVAGTEMTVAMLSMCWSLSLQKGKFFIWKKPKDNKCYNLQKRLPSCKIGSWEAPLEPCLSVSQNNTRVYDWPARLLGARQRLGSSGEVLSDGADLNYWTMLTDFYLSSLSASRIKQIRNVLDMNAGYGGFAAALSMRKPALPWWVLNVSPYGGLDYLGSIVDKGLLGVYHDWCRALDVPPRSFDLVHASRLFSSGLHSNCSALVVIVEMDRLLRPGGFALIRDQKEMLLEVETIAAALHWKTTLVDTDSGPYGKDKLLHCQKTFWQPSH